MNAGRLKNIFLVNLRLCSIELSSNKVRTIITSLGIFLGIASLLANLSFVRAMDDDLKRNLESIGGLGIVTVHDVEPVNKNERIAFQRSGGLTVEEIERVTKGMPSIESVLPQADLHWTSIKAGGREQWGSLTAVSFYHNKAYNYGVSEGRWFTREEMERQTPVCVMGEDIAAKLFGKGVNPVGETVIIRSIPFSIVGIIKSESIYEQRSRETLIPYPVYTSRFTGLKRRVEEIAVLLNDSRFAETAQAELTFRLSGVHRGVNDFAVEINKDKINEKKAASLGMKVILWSIALISVLVGGVSIMNIMFATIGNRIREIGVRKALGAQRHDIFIQFVIEAVIVCCVGGIPGMALGAGVTLFPPGVFPFNPRLTIPDYSLAFFCTVAAGLIAGIFPAIKAADMEPVEALRY
jgi:ABC-type antimicrobial peptide transport system permease subunit